ncbi:MAG: MerR family DNA-binding protein [Marinobacter sp.]|uniref:MerR family transcriptional regulator n=1 Tax=Marinobacter sp. TaxID=50741 RepID=UPI00299E01E3|nr:MerR family DNA-binding protein [Marinobacter sp.]MDX1756948.1 MerR family DNA-binding protein [Marinobacter sp.]
MKVNELAKAAGTSADTVRYYAREGLLNPARDPVNNYQQFTADDLRRLKFARKARQLGFSLPEIKTILDQADDHHSPCPMVRDVFEKRLHSVEQQVAELLQLRDRMRSALSAWQAMPDGTPDGHTICQLIEHWDDPDSASQQKE